MKQAVILVGGRGTRLGALTQDVPKPMLPVGGRPFLEYQLQWLHAHGVSEVLFCSGYLAVQIESHFGDGRAFGVHIRYSVENQPAGTGGALRLAAKGLHDEFFALNGDTLFKADLAGLRDALRAHPEALGCLALRRVPDGARFGCIEVNDGRITRFAEKSAGPGPATISGGVYCLRRSALDLLPAPPCSLEQDLFPRLAGEGRLLGVPFDAYFLDIGLPETLAQAGRELPGDPDFSGCFRADA